MPFTVDGFSLSVSGIIQPMIFGFIPVTLLILVRFILIGILRFGTAVAQPEQILGFPAKIAAGVERGQAEGRLGWHGSVSHYYIALSIFFFFFGFMAL